LRSSGCPRTRNIAQKLSPGNKKPTTVSWDGKRIEL